MDIVAQERKQNKRYLPHTLATRVGAVNLYRYTHDIDFVLRRYHISKASLMRWNKQFDGTRESLMDKSHRPHSQHPNAHTEDELKWIRDYHRWMPNIIATVKKHGTLDIGCITEAGGEENVTQRSTRTLGSWL